MSRHRTPALRRHLLAATALALGTLAASPAFAQAAPALYTSATRYDALGRVTGTIAPDPDGVAPYTFIAVRNTYDTAGNLIKVEKGVLSGWQAETIAPKDWTGFTIDTTVEGTFDAMGRKLVERVKGSDGVPVSLSEVSYTPAGQVKCTAQRMNPATFATPVGDACALGTPATVNGATVNDRITRNNYGVGDPTQLVRVEQAVGTPSQRDYVSYTYTPNGKQASVTDSRGMRATYTYDGFDRLEKWTFPSKDFAATPSATDFESYTYDSNGNMLERRLRDHTTAAPSTLTYTYDALGRQTTRTPTGEHQVAYGYDLRGLLTRETRAGDGQSLVYGYDGFGRLVSEAQPFGTMTYTYDANGNRKSIIWGDGFQILYKYDQLNRVDRIREPGATSGPGLLATYSYTPTGQRAVVTYGNGTTRSYGYDAAGRTTGVKIDLAGTASDLTIGQVAGSGTPVAYNPAGQIVSLSRSNDAYAWTAHSLFERDYAVNGLNQYTSAGGVALGYDGRGNLTTSGPSTFGYSRLNELTSAPNGTGGTVQITYDPKGRLTLYNPGTPLRMVYAGPKLVTETTGAGTILRRYVPGPGGSPVVWYEGTGMADRRWLQTDQLGSVVAISDATGTMLAINRYDEYGIPQSGNVGRFAFTGQTWFGEVGLYNYKARWYSPTLGRFMQTDPIGYKDQLNLYAYVGNDPINRSDPTGMYACKGDKEFCNMVDAGVRQIRRAEWDAKGAGPPTSASRLLGASATALGTNGDRNGVTIQAGSNPKEKPATTIGNTITLDRNQIEVGRTYVGDKWDAYSEVLGHEGTHLWYQTGFRGIQGKLDDERAAYRTQYLMMEYNASQNPMSIPFVPREPGESESQYVRKRSVDNCEASGYNGISCDDVSVGMQW